MTKKKRILVYLGAAIFPALIFLLCCTLTGYLPFKDEVLNAYDSYTQYSGILLEFIRGLKTGNMFYSFGGNLGFNLYGTATYYAFSPLNLLATFANPMNYPYFIALMTFLRFSLLGLTMCFYLEHKKYKPLNIVLFSTIYALMGFTSAYYYNYIWIDSIIMLPLVIHGIDNLIENKKPCIYIVTLTLTILINYYIGYMICLFALIWFLYKLVSADNKEQCIKLFFISSLLSGLMSSIVILPSLFALLAGKASLYKTVDYFGLSNNAITFLYSFTTGSFQITDQENGPALIYSSILVLVLTIFYFLNTKFSKKEKIATFIIILLFYLSFSVNFLNYAWHLFHKPFWWPSRFSFLFSFFLITIGARTLEAIEHTKFKNKYRLLISIIFIIGVLISAFYKWRSIDTTQIFTYFFLGFSILIFIELIFLLDKKEFIIMIILFTFIEISINTFNNLKINYRHNSVTDHYYLKKDLPILLKELNSQNDEFYRFELTDKFTSNDGMYFGYNGINFFNSVRNGKTIDILKKLGLEIYSDCHVTLKDFDPVLLSLLNVKYLYGSIDYFNEIDNKLFENSEPLALGFIVDLKIRDFKFTSYDKFTNRQELMTALTGLDDSLYKTINIKDFEYTKSASDNIYTYSFKSNKHLLLFLEDLEGVYIIDDVTKEIDSKPIEIRKNSKVTIEYKANIANSSQYIKATFLDIEKYEDYMEELNKNLLKAKTNVDGHVLIGTIDVTTDNPFLFTSIPYEEGMVAYVDGEKKDIVVTLDGLVGLEVEKGEHEITIDYIHKGLILGSCISITNLGITLFYLQKRKKAL